MINFYLDFVWFYNEISGTALLNDDTTNIGGIGWSVLNQHGDQSPWPSILKRLCDLRFPNHTPPPQKLYNAYILSFLYSNYYSLFLIILGIIIIILSL